MDTQRIGGAGLHTKLADGLDKRKAFNIAYRAANLYQRYIGIVLGCHILDGLLDGVCQMRHHLYGTPVEIAAPLTLNQTGIQLSRGYTATLG